LNVLGDNRGIPVVILVYAESAGTPTNFHGISGAGLSATGLAGLPVIIDLIGAKALLGGFETRIW